VNTIAVIALVQPKIYRIVFYLEFNQLTSIFFKYKYCKKNDQNVN